VCNYKVTHSLHHTGNKLKKCHVWPDCKMIFPYNSVVRKMPTQNMFKFVCDCKVKWHFLKDKSLKNNDLSSHNYSNFHVMEHFAIRQACQTLVLLPCRQYMIILQPCGPHFVFFAVLHREMTDMTLCHCLYFRMYCSCRDMANRLLSQITRNSLPVNHNSFPCWNSEVITVKHHYEW
jgi:hypothetical protein